MDGVEKGQVRLEEYREEWKEVFLKERQKLEKIEGIGSIEHIGSTSIEGLISKPIVDIAFLIEEEEKLIEDLQKLGYEYRGDGGVEARFFFLKSQEEKSIVHLHGYRKGDQNYLDQLRFRDYLRQSEEARLEYEKLKLKLYARFKDDRKMYTLGKAFFIKLILNKARRLESLKGPEEKEIKEIDMKPVEKNQLVRGKVVDISHEGKAVVKIDGYTVFTDGGIPGDTVDLRIKKAKKNFGLGKTEKIVFKSDQRIRSNCSYSDRCGGCQLQEMDYQAQLDYKKAKIESDLYKFAEILHPQIEDTIGMEEPFNYRNNVQIPVGDFEGKPIIGYFKKGSNSIVDIDKCVIGDRLADQVIEVVRDFMERYSIRGYNPRQHKGIIRHIVVRTNYKKEAMVVIVTNSKKLEKAEVLLEMLKERVEGLVSLVHNINMEKTNLTLGSKNIVLYGKGKLEDKIGELKFEISPESFFQVNRIQTEKMYSKVKEYLDLKGNETVVDLYCGIGTIGMYLADRAQKIIGIELVKESILDGRRNMALNNIGNMTFIEGYAEAVFPELVKDSIEVDALVVDPPRKGMDQDLIEAIKDLAPKKLVYVSCNPATLARDLKDLKSVYKIDKIQPIDMFPHTIHVETVVLLEREI